MLAERRYPVGVETNAEGAHFRLWAPAAAQVFIILKQDQDKAPQKLAMEAEGNGYFSLQVTGAEPGTLYQFQLDDDELLYPDPASRFQPLGPHGPSQVIDSSRFDWADNQWQGITPRGQVIYEMHIGTFTREGNYLAAIKEFPELAALGITLIELMPVNEFDGNFGWGYDGVDLYAPYHAYGTPDELRFFIDQAHAHGMGVILDVVYNHMGSSGCYLAKFSRDYLSEHYKSEWGNVLNFDGKNSGPVREFVINNAAYWIEEFHFDGFRLDATQEIYDASDEHLICALVRAARQAAGKRNIYIVGENEPQQRKLLDNAENKGYGLDALWNDDFHHISRVALTGRTQAYFTDYRGKPQEFVASLKYGFLYQGQWYKWQQQRRGSAALDLDPTAFIHYLQNHDQIANGGLGKRLHQLAHPALYRAMTALLLLAPQTPMLFQGQEFSASSPFLYFADNNKDLVDAVAKGRNEFLFQFVSLATPEMQNYLYRPENAAAFNGSKLDFSERETNKEAYQLHKDLLQLRKTDPIIAGLLLTRVDAAVLGPHAFVLRYFSSAFASDRLLIINMGRDLKLSPIPEPLLAPHPDNDWRLFWSSEYPQYGGHGACEISTRDDWVIPAFSATLLKPIELIFKESRDGL